MTDTPTIHQALIAVMEEVTAIRKEQRNKDQGFNFRGIDQVVNAVGPAIRKHHVVITPHADDIRFETYETSKGTTMRNCVVTMRFVIHGPGGDQIEVGPVFGEASDTGDKGVSKAQSVAQRVALLQALTIPTDEPDPDHETHERGAPAQAKPPQDGPISAENAQALVKRCDQLGLNLEDVVVAGTNGRTNNPAAILISEVPAVRAMLDSAHADTRSQGAMFPPDAQPPAQTNGGALTEKQVKAVNALLKAKRNAVGDARFVEVERIIGREVTSTKDLTKAEAAQVIDKLQGEADWGE